MDIAKINLGSPILILKELNIKSMIETDSELKITLNDRFCYNIYEGQKLIFKRYVYQTDEIVKELTMYVDVINEDSGHTIHTSKPIIDKVPIDLRYGVSGACETVDEDTNTVKIRLLNPLEIYAQDIDANVGQGVKVELNSGELSGEVYTNIFIPFKNSNISVTSADCLTFVESAETCGQSYDKYEKYKYTYLPSDFDQNAVIISGFDFSLISEMAFLIPTFNPFYYTIETERKDSSGKTITDASGNPITDNYCYFWGDVWWGAYDNSIKESGDTKVEYVNSGNSRSILTKNESSWNVQMGFASDDNYTSLGSEDTFTNQFMEELEESLVPDVVDMERFKYSPVEDYAEEVSAVTSITMDFHFIKRKENDRLDSTNTPLTRYNVYEDGWYIDTKNSDELWWNGTSDSFTSGDIMTFIEKSGATSDLLGYLNFTDDDVFYRKKKVNKSFVRLSFYTSKDPVEQRLLYYSTCFLDGSGLYGKYVKQLTFMEDNDVSFDDPVANVVFCSANTSVSRIDSEIVLENEYNTDKSSEGFNVYLFADDADIKDSEKDYRTIYMKVEFNHAGCGKTIPMIMYPSSGLTIDNFIDNLYIPIKIFYNNKDRKHYYSFPIDNKCCSVEDKNIRLMLFEPKLIHS